ncbi:hypothetical protein [Niameybacter sp.]|uniref:hypothetical protein n=1 Tax=Niameybacter sp. TaxID=2033640 RepID=UPI002FC978B2
MGKKMGVYSYRVYGWQVKSEIEIPELIQIPEIVDEEADVIVCLQVMPEDIRQALSRGQEEYFSKDRIWIQIENVGIYELTKGKVVAITPVPNVSIETIKQYFLGLICLILCLQKESLGLHGAAIEVEESAILILGESGSGKSTLTTALRKQGYRMLSDDFCVLGQNERGNSIVYPAYPQQKLCRDTMLEMNYNVNEYSIIQEERDKFAVPIGNGFADRPLPIKAIFILSPEACKEVDIEPIRGSYKVTSLLQHISAFNFTEQLGLPRNYFIKCIQVLKQVPVIKLKRPLEGMTVEKQIKMIKRILECNIDEIQEGVC